MKFLAVIVKKATALVPVNHRNKLLLILAIALVFDTVVTNSMTQTMDEGDHIVYGARMLRGQPDRFDQLMDIKTPVTALNALPGVIATRINSLTFPRIHKFFSSRTMMRFPSVLAALAVIFFVHHFAYELYGPAAALSAALLAALSPNLIAHGTLATTDGYFALGVLAALYFLRRYLLRPTFANACISGFALAAAQIMKPLAVLLYPTAAVFLIAAVGYRSISVKQLAAYVVAAAVCCIGVLNVAYLFDRTLTPLRSYDFQSSLFKSVQSGRFIDVRVPVPYPVLQGLDMARQNDETGATYGKVYLLGTLRNTSDQNVQGFRSYYLVAWLIKEPIALQILFIWGLIHIRRRGTEHGFLFAEGLLLASALILLLFLSFFSKAQVGIRHILPVLAIEVVIAGAAFSEWVSLSNLKKAALVLLVGWLGASTISYYPHMIPYMNEWVLDRRLSYRFLADSNLDWGQNSRLVRDFLKDNPDVVLDPEEPISGRILVRANRLVGILPKDKGPLQWVLRYRPTGHVGYAHLLFEIPERTP